MIEMKYEINEVVETTDIIIVIDWSKRDFEFLSREEYEECEKQLNDRRGEVEVITIDGKVNNMCLEELQGVTDNDWND